MLFHKQRALEFMERFDLDALVATTRHNVLVSLGFSGVGPIYLRRRHDGDLRAVFPGSGFPARVDTLPAG